MGVPGGRNITDANRDPLEYLLRFTDLFGLITPRSMFRLGYSHLQIFLEHNDTLFVTNESSTVPK